MSVWWTDPTQQPITLVKPDDEFVDSWGTTLDPGNYGLFVEVSGDGVVMEGSLDELRNELIRALNLVTRQIGAGG